jgi:hypothetical protein
LAQAISHRARAAAERAAGAGICRGRARARARFLGFSEAAEQQPVAEADAVMAVGVIEVELPQGGRVRISGAVEPAVVSAALRALMRR